MNPLAENKKSDKEPPLTVGKDKVVSLRYKMFNGRGEELENSLDKPPVSYLHGSGGIQFVLQTQLEGLFAGSSKTVLLTKEAGLTDDNFRFEVVIDGVREALPEELLLGYPILPPAPVCEEDCICYDV